MPFKRKGKCVFKINKSGKIGKKKGCSKSVAKAKKYAKALYANSDDIMAEIKDYFRNQQDEDYLAFDEHPLATIENLMNPEMPAPWDDEDEKIEIKEFVK